MIPAPAWRIPHALLVAALAFALMAATMKVSALPVDWWCGLTRFLDNDISRPYVKRQLLLVIANAFDGILPRPLHDYIYPRVRNLLLQATPQSYPGWPTFSPRYAIRVFAVEVQMYVALLVYAFSVMGITRHCFPRDRVAIFTSPFFALIPLFFLYDSNTKFYDYPVLAFNALCIFLILKQRLPAYLTVFAIACTNKETAIYLIPIFVMMNLYTLPHKKLFFWTIAQIVIATVILVSIERHFAHKGDSYIYQRTAIIDYVLMHYEMADLLAVLFMVYFIIARWEDLPVALRNTLWLVPASVLGYLLFGIRLEYRAMMDMLPPLVVIANHTLFHRRV